MSGDYSSRNRRMLKRFLPYYKKYSGLFALDMFCSALTTVCEIALPLIVRQITDRAAHDIHDLTAELIIKNSRLLHSTANNRHRRELLHGVGRSHNGREN